MTTNPEIAGLIQTAMEAQKGGNLSGAETACRKILILDQENLFVQNQLALLLHAQGNSAGGLDEVDKILKKNSGFADGLFSKGKILFDKGQFKEALLPLEEATKNWPYRDARPWVLLGKTFLQLRRYEKAVSWLTTALEKNPKALAAKNDLGLALKNIQKPEAAIRVYEDAISQEPGNPIFYFNQALTHLDLGQHKEAEARLQKAINLKPDYLEAHEALNEIIGEKRDDFLSSYTTAIKAVPDSLDLRIQHVDTLLRTKNEDAGVKALKEIEAAFGEHPRALWRLAKIQITRDQKSEALTTLEKAIALKSGAIELKLEAAKLLIRLGDYNKALGHLETGLGINEFHQELIGYQVMCWRLLGDERATLMNDYEGFIHPSTIPVPKGYKNLSEFNKVLLEVLNKFHKAELSPLGQSLRHGTQTLTSLFSMEVKEIQEARQMLIQTVAGYIDGLPDSKTHPFLKRKSKKIEFSGSWSIQLRDQGFHVNHVHPEGWISASYYVDLPNAVKNGRDNQGCIKFGESPLKLGDREEIGKVVRPQEGLVVMFPSYMFHGTFPFTSDELRTTMPFDVVPNGS